MLVQQKLPHATLGYWIKEIESEEVFAYSKANGNSTMCLEKYLPFILADFPLPLALAVPAINPQTKQSCMCIVHGGDFFEALYRFYRSELVVCPNKFRWISEYDQPLPNRLTWSTAPDRVREQIFYTGVYVVELLSSEEKYFTCAQIEEISKIDFSF